MKKLLKFPLFGMLFLAAMVLMTNCSKEDDPIEPAVVPAFVVTASTVPLQGGGDGLQFTAKCTNDNVKLTKVLITDPLQSPPITYLLNGTTFVKNELFALQATNEAYLKQVGTWKFQFVGNRTADNSSFAIDTTLSVTK